MQCKQCGKWFREFSVDQIYCSIECWNRAQLDGIKYSTTTEIYLDGEQAKTVKNFDIKEHNNETSTFYSDHA